MGAEWKLSVILFCDTKLLGVFCGPYLWTLVRGCCIIKHRKEHIMDITILGFRIRIYQDPKVPKQVHIYITSRDGNTFYVLIQDMGKSVR